MATCKACGREIAADMMFCPYCGTKRTLDQSGRPMDERPEKRIGVVPYVTGPGRLEGIWTLIVSDRRLIFAKALPGDDTAPSVPKSVGIGILSKRGPDSGCGVTYAQRYQEMSPDEAVNESPGNFSVELGDIELMALSQKEEGTYGIAMKLRNGGMEFSMPQQHDHRDHLMKVLGDRISW